MWWRGFSLATGSDPKVSQLYCLDSKAVRQRSRDRSLDLSEELRTDLNRVVQNVM